MDFYNDIDPTCAQWLRNLIAARLIPEGVVDTRDIREIQTGELGQYRRVHFFAGIGGWPLALELSGWPDERPVWTGSCPCQPFSCAGQRKGESDERHLWPEFFRLIGSRRPPVVFGEQVSGSDGLDWLLGVRADLATRDYRVGAADLCAAGVGAPHIRQRLYWVADAKDSHGGTRERGAEEGAGAAGRGRRGPASGGSTGRLADSDSKRLSIGKEPNGNSVESGQQSSRRANVGRCGGSRWLGQPLIPRLEGHAGNGDDGHQPGRVGAGTPGSVAEAGRAYPWERYRILELTDGTYRRAPVEPEFFPLAHGVPGRVGKLRAYGNAIVPQVAAEFIKAYLETERA